MTARTGVDPATRLSATVRRDWAELARPTPSPTAFDPAALHDLPDPAQRWLTRAIAPGTPLRRRVELTQHGRIRIGTWRTFRARQVIAGREGYVWACTTRVGGIPVHGYDRLAHDRATWSTACSAASPSSTSPDPTSPAAPPAAWSAN